MDITVRLYWRTDADLIALNLMPDFDLKEALRSSVIAWANGDKDFSIPCPSAPQTQTAEIIIRSEVIHIQFRGEAEQYIIDKIKSIKYGFKSMFIKNLVRGYLDNPYTAVFMDNNAYKIVKDSLWDEKKKRGPYKKKKVVITNSFTPVAVNDANNTNKEEITEQPISNEIVSDTSDMPKEQNVSELNQLKQEVAASISSKSESLENSNVENTSADDNNKPTETIVETTEYDENHAINENKEEVVDEQNVQLSNSSSTVLSSDNDEINDNNSEDEEELIDDDFDFYGSIQQMIDNAK